MYLIREKDVYLYNKTDQLFIEKWHVKTNENDINLKW